MAGPTITAALRRDWFRFGVKNVGRVAYGLSHEDPHPVCNEVLGLPQEPVQCASQNRLTAVWRVGLYDPGLVFVADPHSHPPFMNGGDELCGGGRLFPRRGEGSLRLRQRDASPRRRLMPPCGVRTFGPRNAGQLGNLGCCGSITGLAQRLRHRGIPAADHRRMAQPQFRNPRDLLVAWPHPVRRENPSPDRIPFLHQDMPVPIISCATNPRLAMLDRDAAVGQKTELRTEVTQKLPKVSA